MPNGRAILDHLDLEVSGEGISVILGPNGTGKTLLLRLLAGLLPATGGSIDWAGAAQPGERLAMVFQQPMLLRMSVFTNVEFALRPQAMSAAERRARTDEVLERVGLAHRARDCARLLSGGERQRLALARAWAMRSAPAAARRTDGQPRPLGHRAGRAHHPRNPHRGRQGADDDA